MTLLARLESAHGADRELDAEIYARIHGHTIFAQWNGIFAVFELPGGGYQHLEALPTYTGSIDAAKTLVPEHAALDHLCEHWRVGENGVEKTGGCTSKVIVGAGSVGRKVQGEGATPALALCIATLKARGIA